MTDWHDADTGARGWFVIDRLVGGMCSGGIRMRPGVTLGEVTDLARTMSHKMAVLDIPYGGAKLSGRGIEGPRYAIHEMTEHRLITLAGP